MRHRRKSFTLVQTVFTPAHNHPSQTISDTISALENLQHGIARYRAEMEMAFRHAFSLYVGCTSCTLLRGGPFSYLEFISSGFGAPIIKSFQNRITECSANHKGGHPLPAPDVNDAIGWFQEQVQRIYFHPSVLHLEQILRLVQIVGSVSNAVCDAINKALEPELKLEHEERQALKKLCEEIRSLNSDIMIYNVLLNAVVSDMESNARSPVTRFIERYVMRTAINFICLPGQWSTIPQRGWKGNNEKPCNSARRYAATARGPKP